MAIIAPFWATTDQYVAFKAGHSKVYYHVYQDTKDNNAQNSDTLKMASRHVQCYDKSGKFSNFNATWVLVVTWEKLCPYVYYPYYYYYSNTNSSNFALNCQWVGINIRQRNSKFKDGASFTGYDYAGSCADLVEGSCSPERKLLLTKHFSKITK